jgi:hypothetical protein
LLRLCIFKPHHRIVELPLSSFLLDRVAATENRYVQPRSRISPRATRGPPRLYTTDHGSWNANASPERVRK